MSMRLITAPISKAELAELAKETFGDMVKAVVDIERKIMAVGGELHSDAEAWMIEKGSEQKNLWGINLYPENSNEEWIEFDSMINLKPVFGNRSRDVESVEIKEKIMGRVI